MLDKFYPPKLVDGKLPYLKYPPWEEFIKSLAPEKVPEGVPDTWLDYIEGTDVGSYRIYMAQFPFVMYAFSYLSMSFNSKLIKLMSAVEAAMFATDIWNKSVIMLAQYAMVRVFSCTASLISCLH